MKNTQECKWECPHCGKNGLGDNFWDARDELVEHMKEVHNTSRLPLGIEFVDVIVKM